MILEHSDAVYAAQKLTEYFKDFGRIDDYFRARKIERVKNIPAPLPGFSMEDDLFQDYDMHPEDMNFVITQIRTSTFDTLLEKVASFSPDNAPGKEMKLVVKETSTNTIVGFIKLGSPLINSKPRNDYLGGVPDLPIFNKRAIMGFNIVPVQPFGYNYLGGKLIAAICNSHDVRRKLNKKYDTEFCLFETTSLYGSTTDASQYDGLKPFMRYKGLTESKFLPLLHDEAFHKLHDRFKALNDNKPLTDNRASSKKMKRQTKMISILRNSMKEYGMDTELKQFNTVVSTALSLTQKKRTYFCEYGYSNVREVILGEQDELIRGPNWDKFYLENIISWWKKKATKRYEKLKAEDRFRTKVELWTDDDEIQIIR